MKKCLLVCLNALLAASFLYAGKEVVEGSRSSIKLRLVNDAGEPLSGVKVTGCQDLTYELNKAVTDSDGYAILSVRHRMSTAGLDAFIFSDENSSFSKTYYREKAVSVSRVFTHENQALNRWEPWNPEITHVVKRIKNPVPMISSDSKSLRLINTPKLEFLFDMMECDWLPPHGKGKVADVSIALLTGKEAPRWSELDAYEKRFGIEATKKRFGYVPTVSKPDRYTLRVQMRFLRQGDGILFDDDVAKRYLGGSLLWHRHEAPSSGYKNEFIYDAMEDFLSPIGTAYIRIRSEGSDAEGKVVKSAIHGVTYNSFGFSYCPIFAPWKPGDGPRKEIDNTPHFLFSYKLNPDTSSRSLEWNGVDARTGKLVRKNWREDQRP